MQNLNICRREKLFYVHSNDVVLKFTEFPTSNLCSRSLQHTLPFLQIRPTVASLFFLRTDSTDSPDCLPTLNWTFPFFFRFFPLSTCWFLASRIVSRSLRSSSAPLLHVPFRRTSFGNRSFSTAAPSVCNSLPVSVQNCDTLTLFKSRLKAHLFSSVYAS